jgi:cytochrome b subunit of formate dehydrogenase
MECHGDPETVKVINDTTEISMLVDDDIFTSSIHGDMECIECHMDLDGVEVEDEHEGEIAKVLCVECHDDVQEEYDLSAHALAFDDDQHLSANCLDCHGSHHAILSYEEENSPTFKMNIDSMCADCHSKPEVLAALYIKGDGPVGLYHESVHSKYLLENPDEDDAPTCISCHGSHKIMRRINPECLTSEMNLPNTCGTCHEKEYDEYMESIHWKGKSRGHQESPGCNDCHGEHRIISAEDEDALTNRLNLSSQICQGCHASKIMMERFGLDANRLESYNRSYHGLSVLRGSPDAATCVSCHEVHAIKSSSDSTASVHISNLEATCGECHDNITADFVEIDMHPVEQETRNPIAYFFKNLYIWLIIITIGGMVIHNTIIYIYHVVKKRRAHILKPTYQRFRPWEVYQHIALFTSFFLLVVTGFALKFPEAGWVKLLGWLGMDEFLRGWIHRVAAIAMTIVSLIQGAYLLFTKTGRKEFKALIPTATDVTDFFKSMKYYLRISKEKPKSGRFDYTEKAEYLALIWGVIVMGSSGVILWWPEFFMRFLPAWIFETSEVIHYYEAWLATLSIIVWHWFFVVYHPEKYPMDVTWTNGKMSLKDLEEHHPLEYEEHLKERFQETEAEASSEEDDTAS